MHVDNTTPRLGNTSYAPVMAKNCDKVSQPALFAKNTPDFTNPSHDTLPRSKYYEQQQTQSNILKYLPEGGL